MVGAGGSCTATADAASTPSGSVGRPFVGSENGQERAGLRTSSEGTKLGSNGETLTAMLAFSGGEGGFGEGGSSAAGAGAAGAGGAFGSGGMPDSGTRPGGAAGHGNSIGTVTP